MGKQLAEASHFQSLLCKDEQIDPCHGLDFRRFQTIADKNLSRTFPAKSQLDSRIKGMAAA